MNLNQSYAVLVNSLTFSYSKSLVLKGINIKVPEACIYGLLGSSGCGKTTLIKCILSRLSPKSGEIKVFGEKPGSKLSQIPGSRVGYMPQEIGLYHDFTIMETMHYFAKIYSMQQEDMSKKINDLLNLLQLMDQNSFIGELSVGQQRRVSLASALIHSPPLLILDEPTVGVDPLLRRTIWNHLLTLQKSGTTIMITTHFMEEAASASLIGFMRDGRILAEDNANSIINRYDSINLEEAIIKLCQINENLTQVSDVGSDNNEVNDKNSFINTIEMKSIIKPGINSGNNINDTNYNKTPPTKFRSKMRALLHKNFLRIRRSWILNTILILLPSFHIILGLLYFGSTPKDLPLGIYNEEVLASSNNNYGQLFTDCINNHTFNKINYNSFEEASNHLKSGKLWAVIAVPRHFTAALKLRKVYGNDIDDETLQEGQIELNIDMSNQVLSAYVRKEIYESMLNFLEKLALENAIKPDLIKLPLFEEQLYNKAKESISFFVVPGCLVIVLFCANAFVFSQILIEENNSGLIERSIVAGVKPLEFIISQLAFQTTLVLMQLILLLLICFVFFGVPNEGSTILFASLLFCEGFAGLSFGIIIASLSKDSIQSTLLSGSSMITFLIVCGVFWPLENAPFILQNISYATPITLPTESLRLIMFKGWGFAYFQVYVGFIVTLVWSFALFFISLILWSIKFNLFFNNPYVFKITVAQHNNN